jgi:RNA polymerase sigma factor (sigma-70 family)
VRAYRLSEADADDVRQITWMSLVENMSRLRDPAQVAGWLATTARRECARQLSSTSRVIPDGSIPNGLSEQVSDSPPLDAALLAAERDILARSAMERLPDRDKKLLGMLMADPAPSYAQTSVALGMPIGSIGPRRARALQRLRKCVGSSFNAACDNPFGTDLPEPGSHALRMRAADRAPSDREIATSFGDADPLDRPDAAVQRLPRERDAAATGPGRRRRGVAHESVTLAVGLASEGDPYVEPPDWSVDGCYRCSPSPIVMARPQNATSCRIALQRREWPLAFRTSLNLRHRIACCRGSAGTKVRFTQLRQRTRTLVPFIVERRGPRETRAGPSRRSAGSPTEDADSELVCREVAGA